MGSFKSIKVKNKILLMLLFPVLGLIYFSADGVVKKIVIRTEMGSIQSLTGLSVSISDLVHELQKERGTTAGYLGSKGAEFSEELRNQRVFTDSKAAAVHVFYGKFNGARLNSEFNNDLHEAVQTLDSLEETRREIDAFSTSADKAISYYTNLNATFLSVIGNVVKISSNAAISNGFSTYVNFLQGKERTGVERAVMSNAFAQDRFAAGSFNKFASLVSEQKVYIDTFLFFATEEQREFYQVAMEDPSVAEVERMRAIALNREQRKELLADLTTDIGYGGLIHQFKNYILRGRDNYVDTFYTRYNHAMATLDRYLQLSNLSDAAVTSAGIVKETLENYAENMEMAVGLTREGMSVEELDSSISISDGPAIGALNKLLTQENFGVEAVYWFETITQKINLLKTVENQLASDVTTTAAALQIAAQRQYLIYMTLAIALIILAALLSFLTARSILTQLGDEPFSMAAIAGRISEGDLTMAFAKNGVRNGSIYHGFAEIVESMNDVLGNVNTAVDQVSSGAGQVAQASQALSQGATQQASSLEEISSSLNEINGQSRQNSETATSANALAKTAAASAENGNEQMGLLVAAMGRINTSSDEIKKIIKVIDDIAFQINLLALNANVEAARAGKYGKGFAVVAEEVRNLAVRSADAVKNTTAMVEESIRNIEEGTKSAGITAEQLEGIVESATKVADYLGDIALASNEQAQGIEQISGGLEQIDQVTQSNTASAEQGASASEELSSQAQQLKEMISRFRLTENGKRKADTIYHEEVGVIELDDADFGKY
ncbi:MAG: hypothetical protein CMN78_05585 [Spirochaetales bacterium]|nr:hypothetical protein [Spirochaetales bacterium]